LVRTAIDLEVADGTVIAETVSKVLVMAGGPGDDQKGSLVRDRFHERLHQQHIDHCCFTS
jgi:hypothetical protein